MLVRELKRLLPFFGPLLVLLFIAVRLYDKALVPLPSFGDAAPKDSSSESKAPAKPAKPANPPKDGVHPAGYVEGAYQDLFSLSTPDKKYFKIVFDRKRSINPNAIPHPFLENTWIIVSQQQRSDLEKTVWFAELICNAVFKNNGELGCVEPPMILPISKTPGSGACTGNLEFFSLSVGPHDARVFYGPSNPYVMYGSTSKFTCFGQWALDFRLMMDWPYEFFKKEQFRDPTELQRPKPYGVVEKNFFLFWDKNEVMYAHYDTTPKRVFSKLSWDGSAGPNLASQSAANDEKCMAKYLPQDLDPETQSIHQATNSLSITLCKRSDPACKPDDSNTFIINIIQHKKYYNFHSVYEPYVVLFQQATPFALHGISKKPLWINGRAKPGEWTRPDGVKLPEQTQMLYVTSISWKKQGQKYHGYIDDVIFVLFGIEDDDTGGIDLVAGDLIANLGLCAPEA